jgi:acetyl esterase/lipase
VKRVAIVLVLALAGGCASEKPAAETAPTASPTAQPTQRPLPTAGPMPADLVAGLLAETEVPFTEPLPCGIGLCEVPLDVLAPAETAEALPTVVLLPGGPNAFTDRRYLAVLAAELAERGAVVFLASYRSPATSNSVEEALGDVRCAVRFARAETSAYGGDPDRLVLVGHSYGSDLVLQTGLDGEPDAPGCLADASGIPTAVVGLAGFRIEPSGTSPSVPRFLLISGSEDAAAGRGPDVAQELRDADVDAEYVELEGIDHFEIVEPDDAPEIVDLILEAAGR